MLNPTRIKPLNQKSYSSGPVVYWMSRDQRVHDNWALIAAQQKAASYQVPLVIVFNLVPEFLNAGKSQYSFMLQSLQQVEQECVQKNIAFHLLVGHPQNTLVEFVKTHNSGMLITDFDPLKVKTLWREKVAERLEIPMLMVDAHNIIPAWHVSDKQEYAAYTIRPKIYKKLDAFLDTFALLKKHPFGKIDQNAFNWQKVFDELNIRLQGHAYFNSGEPAARLALQTFLDEKLERYNDQRNDPLKNAVSHLSPYLHFGQISAQRVALAVQQTEIEPQYKEAFLEELIVRRELSDNFCYYNNNYDTVDGFPNWAQQSLFEHQNDAREYIYSYDEFDNAETHDALWNAAQIQMRITGKMHGYMRMYWAKKILEWTPTPQDAMQIAIKLNDSYSLDGRDPNGYAGIAWSIGGVHDRAWFERPIFGKIRYMNANGCRKKFAVDDYIRRMNAL